MDFNHCYNVYFRWWVLPHQRNVQGFGVVFSKTLHSNKAASLEDLGFQGLRLCSAYIIMNQKLLVTLIIERRYFFMRKIILYGSPL